MDDCFANDGLYGAAELEVRAHATGSPIATPIAGSQAIMTMQRTIIQMVAVAALLNQNGTFQKTWTRPAEI